MIIKAIHAESNGSMARLVLERLRPLQRHEATARADKLMKAQRLVSSQLPKYAYKKTTQKHVSILTHLHREFNVSRPNEVWCGDVTYIWTGRHWSF